MNINEFREYLKIDKKRLDVELIRQPSIFFAVAEAHILACAKKDAAKEYLAEIDATIDGEIRASSEKLTEGAIKNKILINADHLSAMSNYLKLKAEADILGALKDAFDQRKYMLRELCHLQSEQYFEQTSFLGPSAKDAVYAKQRERMAEAKRKNGKE